MQIIPRSIFIFQWQREILIQIFVIALILQDIYTGAHGLGNTFCKLVWSNTNFVLTA